MVEFIIRRVLIKLGVKFMNKPLSLDLKNIKDYIEDKEIEAIENEVQLAHKTLHNATGLGSEFLGWLDLPVNYDKEEFS